MVVLAFTIQLLCQRVIPEVGPTAGIASVRRVGVMSVSTSPDHTNRHGKGSIGGVKLV